MKQKQEMSKLINKQKQDTPKAKAIAKKQASQKSNNSQGKKPVVAAKIEKKAEKSLVPAYVTKPKRGNSAWIFFNTETVASLKAKDPSLDHKEAFSKSAEIWKDLTPDQKAPFEEKQKADD